MEPLKNIFNLKSIRLIADEIQRVERSFDKKAFIKLATKDLEQFEMKDRVRQISFALKQELPRSYKKSVKILINAAKSHQTSQEDLFRFSLWPYLQFIETFGLDDFETSFHGMYHLTPLFTAEFAIRPFLQRYDQKVFDQLEEWTQDESEHIRRLCSEGTRPFLPWGQKVSHLEEKLNRSLKLIEKLRNDPSNYVRRSVANHLNDISRIDEKKLIKTCQSWLKSSPQTKDIIRHATRTLLKRGHSEALKMHGYSSTSQLSLKKFKISPKKIKEGQKLELEAELSHVSKKDLKLLIEYIVYFPKKNGELSPKAFRWKDFNLEPNKSLKITKSHDFKKVTTRKHYPGKHLVEIQINGKIYGRTNFLLSGS